MANTIRIKRRASNGPVGAPTTLAPAEIAYNEADNTLYYGFGDGGVGFASSVIPVAGSGGFVTTGSTQTVSGPKTFSNITITGGSISGITDLAVVDGGTGASTASDARANLSAAVLGANSDITSITGLTTALTVAQGGTGSTTTTAALTALGAYPATNPANYSATVGTVTSVGMMVNTNYMTLDGGTEITTSGTFGIGFKTQAAATVFAGPATGAASSVGFRTLVATDIPALAYLPITGGTVSGAVVITGDLTISGNTTTVSSSTLTVADKNIELAVGSTSEAGATGGGITLHGLVDHTIIYTTGTSSWDFSEHMNLVTGKSYKINGTAVLSATALMGVDVDGGSF